MSVLAVVFTLLSAYTCRYVKVTESDRAPFFFGIWEVEGRVTGLDFSIGNANQCISWVDTDMYVDGSLRAAKSFTVWSTVIGCLVCAMLLAGIVVLKEQAIRISSRQENEFLICLLVGCVATTLLTALFGNAFGADMCTSQFVNRQLTCRWGAGAYYTVGAVVCWVSMCVYVAICLVPRRVSEGLFVTTATGGRAPRRATAAQHEEGPRNQGESQRARTQRNNGRDDNAHSQHQEPTQRRLSSSDRLKAVESKLEEVRDADRTGSTDDKGEAPDNEKTDEREARDIPKGTPLIITSEDSNGNTIRTTITRYVDEKGETVVERSIEHVPGDESEDE